MKTWHTSQALTAHLYQPEWDLTGPSYTPENRVVDFELATRWADTYTHTKAAEGGCLDASFSLVGVWADLEDWLDYLAYHFVSFAPDLGRMYSGFVNKVTVGIGEATVSRGPLMEVANRVACIYTPILDATADPPITGSERATVYGNNALSQVKYGILVDVPSAGQCIDDGVTDEAGQYRDLVLADQAWPKSEGQLDFSATSLVELQVDILGYSARLRKYPVSTAAPTTVQATTKVQQALADEPNGPIWTDYIRLETNTSLVEQQETKYRMADTVVEDIVRAGDPAGSRWYFGVDEDLRPYLVAEPTAPKYQIAVGLNQAVEFYGTSLPVMPWEVDAGEWIVITNLFPGSAPDVTDMQTDPRFEFIESVTWVSGEVQIVGRKYGRLDTFLAQKEGRL